MFWSIVVFFICLFFSFQISTLPYSNPYTLTMIFGKKGSGKTTTMTKLAHQAQRRGQAVYSNIPLPGCFLISDEDVIGDLLPSWYDDMCADIRDIDMPERLTERSLFSELTVEQLSLLESAEQVPVPWDM